MAKDGGKKSFLDYFKMKNTEDEEDEFDDDLFDDDDYDDDDDDDYDFVKPTRGKSKPVLGKAETKTYASKYEAATQQSYHTTQSSEQPNRAGNQASGGKLVDFRDNSRQYHTTRSEARGKSEVFVIKPQETDEAQSVIDFLKSGRTIVINIEGLSVDVAQRIIDYVGGACYAMGGSLNVVSSNIFIATPQDIEVSGDLREELVGQDALTPYLQY